MIALALLLVTAPVARPAAPEAIAPKPLFRDPVRWTVDARLTATPGTAETDPAKGQHPDDIVSASALASSISSTGRARNAAIHRPESA